MKVLVAGDFVPQNRAKALFDEGRFADVLDDVKRYTDCVDLSIVNLEAPVVSSASCSPISKVGPHLKTNICAISALKYAGFKVVTLANNHFRDFGDDGCLDTFSELKKANIVHVGAGNDIEDAQKTLYQSINYSVESRIETLAVINCCEHEFSIADINRPGSNPINPIRQYYSIKEAKKDSDFVIVITHGGVESLNLPTEKMIETYRFFVDSGADAVINHHQHCFSGYEVYKGKPIFYGLGNFCFDRPQHRNDFWNYGFMVELEFVSENDCPRFRLIPYVQGNDNSKVTVLHGTEEVEFYNKISDINGILSDKVQLKNRLDELSDHYADSVMSWFEPYSGRVATKMFSLHLLPKLISRKTALRLYDRINCESHRERALYALKSRFNNKQKNKK